MDTCLFLEAYLLKYYILYGFYTFLPQRSFLYIIWALTLRALTLLILEMGVLVRNWITEITELFSVISVIQRADQRSEIHLKVFSDPPSGLLRLLNFFFRNLSNPKGGSEIRDSSESFL